MSVLVQKATATFHAAENGRQRFSFSAEVTGHSELQSDLLKALFNARTARNDVVIGTGDNGHETIEVFIDASEQEVLGILAFEKKRRELVQVGLPAADSDVAAALGLNDAADESVPEQASGQIGEAGETSAPAADASTATSTDTSNANSAPNSNDGSNVQL